MDLRTLSTRQAQLYELVGRCLPNGEIAALMRSPAGRPLTVGTVKGYMRALSAKLGLSRYQMIRQAAIDETRAELLGREPGF